MVSEPWCGQVVWVAYETRPRTILGVVPQLLPGQQILSRLPRLRKRELMRTHERFHDG
jgi:hypothetical protein